MDSATSNWVPISLVDDSGTKKDAEASSVELSDPGNLLEGARQLGREISSHFDCLMKMALEGRGDVQAAMSGVMETIPENIPRAAMMNSEKPVEITTKKHKHIGVDSYAIPKSQSFDSDPLAEAKIPLPPHHSRRSRNKIAVARKKNTPKQGQHQPEKKEAIQNSLSPLQSHIISRDSSVSSLSANSFGHGLSLHCNQSDKRKMLT
jgi:hypothetical protein